MRIRLGFAALLVGLGLASCAGPREAVPERSPEPETWQVTDDLRVTALRPGVWVHTTWRVLDGGGRFPSNGLLVRDSDGLLLIDTAWGEAPTEALLVWAEATLGRPVTRAVVTHWHDDRVGGAAVLAARGISFSALPVTRRFAAEAGLPEPDALPVGAVGGAATVGPVEVFYPGPGHTEDNAVVWLPEQRVLFGGCAVKSAAAGGLGYVADADLDAWPEAIRRVQARYAEADLVVPGHGRPGGIGLLAHTLNLLTGE